MSPKLQSPSEPQPDPAASWRQRLSEARHDLRNPLGEIVGFAEVLIEDAQDQRVDQLLPGLEQIRQLANRILADVNHTLNPDTPHSDPEMFLALRKTVHALSGEILSASRELADQCDDLGITTLGDDLLRITGSARQLQGQAATVLDALPREPVPVHGSRSSSGPDRRSDEKDLDGDTGPEVDSAAERGAILVVDDQETNRALLARRLRKQGHSVSLAENGRHALQRLRSRRFDLVLLDVVMPEIDGLEVLRQVKADPDLQNIPVLMLSAVDELDAVVRCIALGADDYLSKPFPAAILGARVRTCLAKKRLSDQLRKYTGWLFGKTLFNQAVAAPASLALQQQERTVLFADIRGFTRWTEAHPPEETVALLNHYFENAEQIWAESSVIKTEYTGDEIMGVFPEPQEAVRSAHRIRQELVPWLADQGLGLGVGIHTGTVIEGLVGGADVKAYCFVGDTVNTANRICGHAEPGQILISETTFNPLSASITTGPPFEISPKGKAAPLKVRPLLAPSG